MQDGTPIIIKKVKKGGHGHHGGAWKIALADFMTAMFAFFLVMWLVGLSPEDRSVIQAYFNDPMGFGKNPPNTPINLLKPGGPRQTKDGDSGSTKARALAADAESKVEAGLSNAMKSDPQIAKLLKEGKLQMRVTNDGLVIEFVENEEKGEVFFTSGSATVRPQARTVIAKVARILTSMKRDIKIQGHTDARPFNGNGLDNYDLSGQRANAVRRLLMASGLSEKQIVGVEALAATQPRRIDDPNHFSNRRVTVLLPFERNVTELKNLPSGGFDAEREAHFLLPKDQAMTIRPDLRSKAEEEKEEGKESHSSGGH